MNGFYFIPCAMCSDSWQHNNTTVKKPSENCVKILSIGWMPGGSQVDSFSRAMAMSTHLILVKDTPTHTDCCVNITMHTDLSRYVNTACYRTTPMPTHSSDMDTVCHSITPVPTRLGHLSSDCYSTTQVPRRLCIATLNL